MRKSIDKFEISNSWLKDSTMPLICMSPDFLTLFQNVLLFKQQSSKSLVLPKSGIIILCQSLVWHFYYLRFLTRLILPSPVTYDFSYFELYSIPLFKITFIILFYSAASRILVPSNNSTRAIFFSGNTLINLYSAIINL